MVRDNGDHGDGPQPIETRHVALGTAYRLRHYALPRRLQGTDWYPPSRVCYQGRRHPPESQSWCGSTVVTTFVGGRRISRTTRVDDLILDRREGHGSGLPTLLQRLRS